MLQDEVVAYVRRRSSAFSRGKSRFRGVSGHEGRWEARIGSFQGRKNVSGRAAAAAGAAAAPRLAGTPALPHWHTCLQPVGLQWLPSKT
jgi:hypothetical protein